MDFLRRLFLQTQNHLKDLTLSQRLAIGSCAALIVVSLLWMVQWAAEPELVPLLKQSIPDQDLGPIQRQLDATGGKYKVVNGMILVPADARSRLMAQLTEAQALPKDMSVGFEELIKESNPWIDGQERDWRHTVALSNELTKILRCMEGIVDARVLIDKTSQRRLSGASVTPSASVYVKLAPDLKLDKKRTFAIASLVSRAVANLDITRVAVTDASGRTMYVPAQGDFTPEDDLEYRQKQEQHFADKIQNVLGIPGLLVAVHAEINHKSTTEIRTVYDEKPFLSSEKTESKSSDTSRPGGGAPGVTANVGTVVAAGGPTMHTEENKSESTYQKLNTGTINTITPRLEITALTASVNVPRSYLARIYKEANNKEPTDADLSIGAQEELKKIKGLAGNQLGVKPDADAVVVEWFHDEAMPAANAVVEAGIGGRDFTSIAKTYGGKAGLGALAVVSLFMMLMMVRKVSEGPVLPGEEPPKPQIIRIIGGGGARGRKQHQQKEEIIEEPETLTVGSPAIGEAEAREQLLVGREVDESTFRVQQVVDQVTDMVRNDPKTSAEILQRWIEAEKQ